MTAEHETRALARLGYKQELARGMGGFASFAVSFSVISVLTGVLTTYGVAIRGAGPAGLGLGWPLVGVGTLLVALAMGELASAFPTAGALYHWSSLLGGTGWGWFTASINVLGQAAIVAAVDLGCAQELAGVLGLGPSWTLPLLAAVLGLHGALNVVSPRLVAWLSDGSAVVHVVGVMVIVVALLAFGHPRSPAYLLRLGPTTRADGSLPLGFVGALLLGTFTFTGYDASAHMSEETRDASVQAPRGIVSAVLVSAVAGYALVVALTLAIDDIDAVAASAHPALAILERALGAAAGRGAMGLGVVAMFFCGLSSVTSASRTLYAFARDGGVPAGPFLAAVSPRFKAPGRAVAAMVAASFALVAATAPLGDSAFSTIVTMATTGLYLSYGAPIVLGAIARHRGTWRTRGPFHLGDAGAGARMGVLVRWAAAAWIAFAIVAALLPPNTGAAWALAAELGALATTYVLWARPRFRGPPVDLAHFEARLDPTAAGTGAGA